MAGATDPSGMWTYRFFGSTEPIEIAGVEMKTWWDFFRKGTFGNLMVKQFVDWRIGVETTYSLNIGVAGATGPRHAPGGPADLDSGTLFSLHWRKKSMEWPTFLVIEDGHMMWHDNWRVGLHGLETKFERLNNKLCMRNVILKQGKCRIQKNGYNNFIDWLLDFETIEMIDSDAYISVKLYGKTKVVGLKGLFCDTDEADKELDTILETTTRIDRVADTPRISVDRKIMIKKPKDLMDYKTGLGWRLHPRLKVGPYFNAHNGHVDPDYEG